MDEPKGNRYLQEAHKLIPSILGVLIGFVGVGAAALVAKAVTLSEIQLTEILQIFTAPAVVATVFVALRTHRQNLEFSKSREYLDNATNLLNKARKVLTDSNGHVSNDRINWVTAARLITRAEHLVSLITVDAHQKIFESEHDYQRHDFAEQMKYKGENLPASFYLGGEFAGLSLGTAARHSSQQRDTDLWIPTRIVAVVYRFFQYPKNYEDPLDNSQEFNPSELERLWLLGNRELCNYLTFRANFTRLGKQVYLYKDPIRRGVPMSTTQIDDEMASISGLS